MSLNEGTVVLLEEGKETLAWAWEIDQKYPKSYPGNTGNVFHDIKIRLRDVLKPESKRPPSERKRLMPIAPPPPPKSFSELIYDTTIKVVYEDQNADTYRNALQRAARGDRSTFRKILNAIYKAYVIDQIGAEAAPPPKIHFLHKNLLEIVKLSGLDDLTDQGILEFLEDLCPCGKAHQQDAIRKLRKRWAVISGD